MAAVGLDPGRSTTGAGTMADTARILTLQETAEMFRVSPRWLRETVNALGIPVLRKGRVIRFDNIAIESLKEAMRQPAPSLTRTAAAYSRTRSGRSTGKAYENALRLTAPPPREKRPPRSRSTASLYEEELRAMSRPSRKRRQ